MMRWHVNPSRSWRRAAAHGIFALWLLLTPMQGLFAAGTSAGTTITNQAGVTYTVGASNLNTSSNVESFVVDHRVDLTVAEASGGYTIAAAGATQQVQTFTVTNSGNASQDFALSPTQQVGGFDPFTGTDPETFNTSAPLIFVESGATPGYQAAEDTTAFIDELAADASATVYVVADIPAAQVNSDVAAIALTATAHDAGAAGLGALTTETAGANTPGVDVVFADGVGDLDAARSGSHSDTDAYRVVNVAVSVTKSAAVLDPDGGTEPVTNAVITYTVNVTVSGSGTAQGIVITDPIPANTSYNAGTLTLNAGALSDVADADAGDVDDTTAGTVTVDLGDLTSASPVQTITFDVTIN